jgi:tetratricopeptide (TPR) repeat protein
LAKTYTTSAEAYRLYLQGRFYWNKREEKDFRKATEYYHQAIALDPNYALALAGLADAYALLATFGFVPPTEGVPKAREFARHALALDESMAEPHTTLAYLSATYDYDFAAAEQEFKRAIELNPNYATAHQWYGLTMRRPNSGGRWRSNRFRFLSTGTTAGSYIMLEDLMSPSRNTRRRLNWIRASRARIARWLRSIVLQATMQTRSKSELRFWI